MTDVTHDTGHISHQLRFTAWTVPDGGAAMAPTLTIGSVNWLDRDHSDLFQPAEAKGTSDGALDHKTIHRLSTCGETG